MVRFYNNLQQRGDCQTTRKLYKTQVVVGWVVGWKKSAKREASSHSSPRPHFWLVIGTGLVSNTILYKASVWDR